MPELPEVERARRLIHDHAVGHVITGVHRPTPLDDKVFVNVPEGAFERALLHKTLRESHRHGKQLWWTLADDDKKGGIKKEESGEDAPSTSSANIPMFHLGMTGAFVARGVEGLQYYNSKASGMGDWPPRFAKLVVTFANGAELAYVDPRRFGKIKLVPELKDVIGGLGPDPYHDMPNAEDFVKLFAKRSIAIKSALMDQKLIAGIGNWMADEILYRARVHPECRSNELSVTQFAAIREQVEYVVRVACEANSDHDLFPNDWLFHVRWGKTEGAKVNGDAIKFIEVGGRTTAYVPKLQLKTDGGPPAIAALTKKSPTKKRQAAAANLTSEQPTSVGRRKAPVKASTQTPRARLPRAAAIAAASALAR
jgi:formamidopyrimidine-DNA glycosylase